MEIPTETPSYPRAHNPGLTSFLFSTLQASITQGRARVSPCYTPCFSLPLPEAQGWILRALISEASLHLGTVSQDKGDRPSRQDLASAWISPRTDPALSIIGLAALSQVSTLAPLSLCWTIGWHPRNCASSSVRILTDFRYAPEA